MRLPAKKPPGERAMQEWIAYGFRLLNEYLSKHAAFDAWCRRHGRP